MLIEETKKRNVAYKLRIGDILKSKPIVQDGKFLFLELGDKKIVRINVVANIIEKYESEGEKKFSSITVDDASGQIKLKAFGDDTEILKGFLQGDTLRIIGTIREYNSELYILPEIAKKIDPKWLMVRKLEIQNLRKDMPIQAKGPVRDILLQKIKNAETNGGIDIDSIILDTEASPDLINQEIRKLLEEGLIYEPRPGRLRYLG
ncbi:MAG: OB-fold nucleic acid binding domain-containing protein [Nanoarchaeota archaeon]